MAIDAWFRPVSAHPLAALRVTMPLLLLVHLLWLSDDILALHGSRGLIPWELAEVLRDPWLPALSILARALLPLGISAHAAVVVWLSIYAGSLLSLALGLHVRLSALLAWGLHVSLVTSGFASHYGADEIANAFLLYLFLFSSGRAWTFVSRPVRSETIPVGSLRVMQLHLCVIYLAAGLDKAMGAEWWNGEAIWQAVSQPAFRTFDLRWLASYPWIPMLAGWGTLVVEIGYALFIWPRRTRKVWFMATLGLHLGIAVLMGLVFFSSVMILLTGCLFMLRERVSERSREALEPSVV
jgi:hypothetical protein